MDILELNNGELISFETSDFKNGLHELLNSLRGWNDYVELSKDEVLEISTNTKIKIDFPKYVDEGIFWSTADFEAKAEENFEQLKEDHPEEFKHLESWEQLYDKTQFAHQLKRMISAHDATIGITWLTIEEYLGNCEIKST